MATETWKTIPKRDCPHVSQFDLAMESDKVVCEACGRPSPLRRCLTCGYVGCC